MDYASATDPKLLGTLESWLRDPPEILVLIRYSRAAGNKDFEFFSSFDTLSNRTRQLPPMSHSDSLSFRCEHWWTKASLPLA
jgi:hypothetical protein